MSGLDVDTLFESFCSSLSSETAAAGRELAATLGLAPNADVPWSQVFKNPVTLEAPALLCEGISGVGPTELEKAVFAHMLSIIEAFGGDRVADGQVADTVTLRRVLACTRASRDDALEALGGASARSFAGECDAQTNAAIAEEHVLLRRGEGLAIDVYRRVSAGKQAVGLPATLALAKVAGLDARGVETVRRTLMGVWLGLQFHDDVVDWKDDLARGGAWMAALAKRRPFDAPAGDAGSIEARVLASGVLTEVLELSAESYEEAARGAELLGAQTLARWASSRATDARAQAEGERRSPGFVGRMRKLEAWKSEVLA
jgi:hypothetical protein